MKSKKQILPMLFVVALSACATGSHRNDLMTGNSGMSFYTFDKDAGDSGKSACYGSCEAIWPPVPVNAASGPDFGSITRDDGNAQLTYRGRPVYYYLHDQKPGDVTGDNLGGVWHALREQSAYALQQASGGDTATGYR